MMRQLMASMIDDQAQTSPPNPSGPGEGLHVFVLFQQLPELRVDGLLNHLPGALADEILEAQTDFR